MNNERNGIFIGAVFVVAAILIIAGVFAFLEFYKAEEKTKKEEKPVEEVVDDRISPLCNQGLILEVNRIRDRGLLDKLLKLGSTSWRIEPTFYFISNIDGQEYMSKNLAGPTASSEFLFNTWDMMFQENKVMRDVEEEQETSDVTLTIVERVKKGSLGFRTQDIEQEKIHVIYDYRTGRWTGDDCFQDYDGYGHYAGEYFEVWFNLYQTDYDSDGIPYWTEVNVIHTNPRVDDRTLDPDDDGCPSAWEWKWGYDPFTWDDHEKLDPDIDGIENIEEYQMAKWFADPFSQDIYIEVDNMEATGFLDPKHVLSMEAQEGLIERFCEHNIRLYIDQGWSDSPKNGGGDVLPHYNAITQDSGMMLQFYRHYFPDERKGIFRYLVMGHGEGFCHPSYSNKYDEMHVGFSLKGLIKKLTLPRGAHVYAGAHVMHELGHSLGVSCWTIEGCDNLTWMNGLKPLLYYRDTWGQYYRSVMNYYCLGLDFLHGYGLFDYSDGSNGPPYDMNDWEHLYLPYFQIEAEAIEEPYFEPPGINKLVYKNTESEFKDWIYDENLTRQENLQQQYEKTATVSSPLSNGCEWRVYVKSDGSQQNQRKIKIYAKPQVYPTYAEWSLVKEGYVDSDGAFHFYSMQSIIDEKLSKVS